MSDAVLDSPGLRLVCCARGGPVNIDSGAAAARGIPVTTTPGKNANAVVEPTIAFLIMLARGSADPGLPARRGRARPVGIRGSRIPGSSGREDARSGWLRPGWPARRRRGQGARHAGARVRPDRRRGRPGPLRRERLARAPARDVRLRVAARTRVEREREHDRGGRVRGDAARRVLRQHRPGEPGVRGRTAGGAVADHLSGAALAWCAHRRPGHTRCSTWKTSCSPRTSAGRPPKQSIAASR